MDIISLGRLPLAIAVLNIGRALVAHAQPVESGPFGGDATNRLLVVTPRAWMPALQEFAAHKRTLRPTDIHPLEDVLQGATGVDDPEKLKRFLYAEWHERGLGYVLLVGGKILLLDRAPRLDQAQQRLVSAQHLLPGNEVHVVR